MRTQKAQTSFRRCRVRDQRQRQPNRLYPPTHRQAAAMPLPPQPPPHIGAGAAAGTPPPPGAVRDGGREGEPPPPRTAAPSPPPPPVGQRGSYQRAGTASAPSPFPAAASSSHCFSFASRLAHQTTAGTQPSPPRTHFPAANTQPAGGGTTAKGATELGSGRGSPPPQRRVRDVRSRCPGGRRRRSQHGLGAVARRRRRAGARAGAFLAAAASSPPRT